MSLLNDIEQAVPKLMPQGCKTCLFLSTEDEETNKAIQRWNNMGWSHTQLYRLMKEYGYSLSLASLKNHLNKCYQDA